MNTKVLKKNLQIAIDGPIGVGKSTLAFDLAKILKITYVYTGVMYRAVTYLAELHNKNLNDELGLLQLLKQTKLELKPPSKKGRYSDIYLNNVDITNRLFTKTITNSVAQVAKLSKIRQYLVGMQQDIARNKSVIMDGRDIGAVVLPQADIKVYLEADLSVRAKRRWLQLKKIGKEQPFEEVQQGVKKRDYEDMHRQVNPLRKLSDSFVIDTTNLSTSQTVDLVIKELKKRGLVQ